MRRTRGLAAAALLVSLHCALAEERPAALSWETLAQVSVTHQRGRYVPEFSTQLIALDKKAVTLKGFMVPFDQGLAQTRFLLSAEPAECPDCLSATAEQFAEVVAKTPLKYVTDAITVSGTFALVRDDSGGLLYRLTEAVMVDK